MGVVLLDVMWGFPPEVTPRTMPAVGGLSWRSPGFAVSAALLREAGRLGGDTVVRCVQVAALASTALGAELAGADEVVVFAPAPYRAEAERALAPLAAHTRIRLLDPWGEATAEDPLRQAQAFDRLGERVAGLAEVDVFPRVDPVHPWVVPVVSDETEAWPARVDAAAAALAGGQEARLWLNDARVPCDMDRLRHVARAITRLVGEHETLLELHLRVWARDLLDRRVVDHLTLLPVGSLEVLCGGLTEDTSGRDPRGGTPDEIALALSCVRDAGMAHVAGVSVALALPGITAEETVEELQRVVDAAASARIRRVRCALWAGPGVAADTLDFDRRFLASHEDWHPLEYRGVFDFVAVLRSAVPQLSLIGPGWLPGWEPAQDDGAGYA